MGPETKKKPPIKLVYKTYKLLVIISKFLKNIYYMVHFYRLGIKHIFFLLAIYTVGYLNFHSYQSVAKVPTCACLHEKKPKLYIGNCFRTVDAAISLETLA